VHFSISLIAGGLAYFLARSQRRVLAALVVAVVVLGAAVVTVGRVKSVAVPIATIGAEAAVTSSESARGLPSLAWSGLRSGLLTFGGAYTVIPFLREDATVRGAWMSDRQFLDGLALSGILPAPLIIFATFVGYLGGGPWGALVMTVAIFAPAFAFTLLGHDFFERLVHRPRLRVFLDGVAAAVVGLIAATALELLTGALDNRAEGAVFAAATVTLFRWNAKLAIPVVIGGAALVGLALSRV
jgi:chromate transporter